MHTVINPWSYAYISKLAEEAAALAEYEKLQPIPAPHAAMNFRVSKRFNIPFLGSYVHPDWEYVGEVGFVDTTGTLKQDTQDTVTYNSFYRLLESIRDPNLGYAVIEKGQTKVLVASYRRKRRNDDAEEE